MDRKLQFDQTFKDELQNFKFLTQGIFSRTEKLWKQRAFDQGSMHFMVKSGLLKRIVPQPFGQANSWQDSQLFLEVLAIETCETGFSLGLATQLWVIRALLEFGSQSQQGDFIPRIMNGELAATAIAEDHSGGNLRASKTRVSFLGEDGWELNGSKSHISLSAQARLILLPVFAEDGGFHVFLVDGKSEGIRIGKKWEKMGCRTLPTCDIHFEKVKLDLHHRLADGKSLASIMGFARILFGTVGAGCSQWLTHQMMGWMKSRISGDGPIGNFQYMQGRAVESSLAATSASQACQRAMVAMETGSPDLGYWASAAKLAGSQAYRQAAEHAVAAMGSRGYEEGAVSRAMRDALGLISSGGTEEFHKRQIYSFLKRSDS